MNRTANTNEGNSQNKWRKEYRVLWLLNPSDTDFPSPQPILTASSTLQILSCPFIASFTSPFFHRFSILSRPWILHIPCAFDFRLLQFLISHCSIPFIPRASYLILILLPQTLSNLPYPYITFYSRAISFFLLIPNKPIPSSLGTHEAW